MTSSSASRNAAVAACRAMATRRLNPKRRLLVVADTSTPFARPSIGACADAESAAARLLLVAVWREGDWVMVSPTGRDEVGRSGQGVIDA